MGPDSAPEMALLQESLYGAQVDYEPGSPHLRHAALRSRIVARIRELVAEQFARAGRCRVLEVGAGHGAFTDHVAAAGAEVTVTEMSRPSVQVLTARYAANPRVRVCYDPDGTAGLGDTDRYDLVLCISVLHHIPDYLGFVRQAVAAVEPGGAFACFQDPLWYPRRGRADRALELGSYYAWRLGQGQLQEGLRTLSRRLRGVLDESRPNDMVEYHVVRQGLDERQLVEILRGEFEEVREWRYWSTQAPVLQAVLTGLAPPNTFGLTARRRC
jgi:SAM-dependent methyltransferase